MADVRDAIVKIQAIARALSGMKEAPDDARGAMNAYPFAVSYPGTGNFNISPATNMQGIHELITEMHVASETDLQQAIKHVQSFIGPFANDLLNDPTLGGTISTMVTGADGPPVSYTFVSGNYNGIKTIALRWRIKVKMQAAIT